MKKSSLAWVILLVAVPAWARASHHGGSGDDRASFGDDITVSEGETAGDIACAFCSVHLHGSAHGDIAVLFGSVTVDESQSVSGDVAVLGGDVALEENSSISGDLALLAGNLHIAENAAVHGDRVVFPGKFWLLVPFAPLLILIGIIWLLVWLVRRNRYPRYYPPPGRI